MNESKKKQFSKFLSRGICLAAINIMLRDCYFSSQLYARQAPYTLYCLISPNHFFLKNTSMLAIIAKCLLRHAVNFGIIKI